MFFEFAGPFLKMFILRTNSSEAKRLTIRDRGFAILWVATIHSEVLVQCVRGLDIQISADLAVPQVDPRVEEGHRVEEGPRVLVSSCRGMFVHSEETSRVTSADHEAVNLIVGGGDS